MTTTKRTWKVTLPNGKTLTGHDEYGRTGNIVLSQNGANAGSMTEAVWLDGLAKMQAAGATVELTESEF